MTRDRQYSGSAGNPIQLRTTRQTEPQRSQRLTRTPCVEDEENTDAWTVEKPHTSAVRYDRPPHKRTSMLPEYQKTTRMRRHSMDRWTLLIIVSLLVIVMLGGWWLFSTVTSWWTNVQDDWKYGSIRTYQADQFVGQGDSTDHPDHFIVVNTHGQVIVIQINPQHPDLDHIYGITTSDPKTPVSLNFRPTGTTWAMYVIVGDTTPYSVELVSNGKQFVTPR